MNKIISRTIEIKCPKMPPSNSFIEKEIKKQGFEVLRWAIIDVKENTLKVSISGSIL